MEEIKAFKPYIAPEQNVAEFTIKSIVFGVLFGVLFGASTVYLALKAGLTVYLHSHSRYRHYTGSQVFEDHHP